MAGLHRSILTGASVLAATAALLSAPGASASTSLTLHYSGVITSYQGSPMRSGGAAQRAGDQAYFVTTLTAPDGSTGAVPHHCVAVDATYTLCTAQVELGDGQLSLQSLLSPANSPSGRIAAPVTGGTGRYAGAHGEAVIDVSGTNQAWTVSLVLG